MLIAERVNAKWHSIQQGSNKVDGSFQIVNYSQCSFHIISKLPIKLV